VEVIFEVDTEPRGLTWVGFAVGERRDGGKNVTCPAREYSVNGARRHVLLLRSSNRALEAQEPLQRCILDAHSRLETHA